MFLVSLEFFSRWISFGQNSLSRFLLIEGFLVVLGYVLLHSFSVMLEYLLELSL